MTPALALVTSVDVPDRIVNYDVREINALEELIATADTDVDAMLWRQAERVVALLDSGMSQRALARQWLNVKTEKPYVVRHVQVVRQVLLDYLNSQDERPRFRDAYNAIANPGIFGRGDDEWYTDATYVEAARCVLGTIDLDPASCAAANAVVKATHFFTLADDGLTQRWVGNVWLNPPYSRAKIGPFCERLVASVQAGEVPQAVALVRGDTDARWFAILSSAASAVCLPRGRVRFWKPGKKDGQANIGTALFYFGSDPQGFQRHFQPFGKVWFTAAPEQEVR